MKVIDFYSLINSSVEPESIKGDVALKIIDFKRFCFFVEMKFKSLSILLLPFDEFDQGEFSV